MRPPKRENASEEDAPSRYVRQRHYIPPGPPSDATDAAAEQAQSLADQPTERRSLSAEEPESASSRYAGGRKASTVVTAVQPRTLCTDDDHDFSEDPHCWCGRSPLVGKNARKVAYYDTPPAFGDVATHWRIKESAGLTAEADDAKMMETASDAANTAASLNLATNLANSLKGREAMNKLAAGLETGSSSKGSGKDAGPNPYGSSNEAHVSDDKDVSDSSGGKTRALAAEDSPKSSSAKAKDEVAKRAKKIYFACSVDAQVPDGKARAVLPEAWDWRNAHGGVNYLTWNRNQHLPSYCGSCWAHAATSCLADRFQIQAIQQGQRESPSIALSVQSLVNCNKGGNCGGGEEALRHEEEARF